MTKPTDDLEAVRILIQALEPFDSKDRERIIRWAAEKLGMTSSTFLPHAHREGIPEAGAGSVKIPAAVIDPVQKKDIKSFILSKNPQNDNNLAAVVAYYYHFEASPDTQRDYITKDDLIDACRKAERKRPARPDQVLVNAYGSGLLDKAGERGHYRLNSVGENLVAMVLPEGEGSRASTSRKKKTIAKTGTAQKKRIGKSKVMKKQTKE
jgi:hypothetical protein